MLSLEAQLGLGLGGFARLPSHEQARLLAWYNVMNTPPEGAK